MADQNHGRPVVGAMLLAACLLLVAPAYGLGPHEVLLLANRNSPRSLELARDYLALRQIPEVNLVALDLPANQAVEITPDDFTAKIWDPAQKASRERGLGDHILAWVYSVDFPIRITTSPAISIQGLTFLKNKLPDKVEVERGTYASPLFAGPENPRISGFPPQSFDVQAAWLGGDMPLPSMLLGYMGPNGNTREEIMACLKAGLQADQARITGTVLILTNGDVRTLCRSWEFAPVARELAALGIPTLVTNALPAATNGAPAWRGAMLGAESIPGIAKGEFRFQPGAIAEHLTSFGATFDNNNQTKITEWIRAGATASAGTITEPFSVWAKFPHARVFVHQAAGCTALESLFQSIRSPLQILLIGEPLANQSAPRSGIALAGLTNGILEKATEFRAEVTAQDGELFNRFVYLVDGKTVRPSGKSPIFTLAPDAVAAGRHKLRVVAYKVGAVRSQIFAEIGFEVK